MTLLTHVIRTVALAAITTTVAAQTAAPPAVETPAAPAAPAASALAPEARTNPDRPLLPKAAPRVPSPAQRSAQTVTPGQLRPENPVTPQVALPVLGAASGPATLGTPRPAPAGVLVPRGGVDDAVARCNAETNAVERARCREELAVRGERAPG